MTLRHEWDVLDFPRMNADSATTDRFVRLAREQGVRHSVWQSATGSPWITLQSSWNGYLRSRSTNFRKGLGRTMRRLAERGKVRLETVAHREKLGQGLADRGRGLEGSGRYSDRIAPIRGCIAILAPCEDG